MNLNKDIIDLKHQIELGALKKLHLEKRHLRELEIEAMAERELEHKLALKKLELNRSEIIKGMNKYESDGCVSPLKDDSFYEKSREHTKLEIKQEQSKGNQELNLNVNENLGGSKPLIVASVRPVHSQTTNKKKNTCPRCGTQGHSLFACSKFKQDNISQRWMLVIRKGLCRRCLKPGHRYRNCFQNSKCSKCEDGSHCTLLHRSLDKTPISVSGDEVKSTQYCSISAYETKRDVRENIESKPLPCGMLGKWPSGQKVALPNLPIKVGHVHTYAFINGGSAASICAESLANKLNVKRTPVSQVLRTSYADLNCTQLVSLKVYKENEDIPNDIKDVYVTKNLNICTDKMITAESVSKWQHLRDLALPVRPSENFDVELIIGLGSSLCRHVLDQRHGGESEPSALKTSLGWVVLGPVEKD